MLAAPAPGAFSRPSSNPDRVMKAWLAAPVIDGAIWSGKFNAPVTGPQISSEAWGERLGFLEGFETDATQSR
jgi:hypothetical protein